MSEFSARILMPQDAKQAGLMIGVLAPALLTTLRALAAQHGNKNGDWFEQLSAQLLKKAKSGEGVGTSIDDEAAGMGFGIEALQVILNVIRRDLV